MHGVHQSTGWTDGGETTEAETGHTEGHGLGIRVSTTRGQSQHTVVAVGTVSGGVRVRGPGFRILRNGSEANPLGRVVSGLFEFTAPLKGHLKLAVMGESIESCRSSLRHQ